MLRGFLAWVQHVLLPLGAWGLVPAAMLDSSFLTLVGGVDLWLISLCVSDPARTPMYVLFATAGSVIGASILYWTLRKGEEVVVERYSAGARIAMIRQRLERSGAWGLFVAAMLPPPTPFKLFVAAAGMLKLPFGKSILGLTVGRLIRFSVAGFLAVRYGKRAWDFVLTAGPWAAVAVAVAVGLLAIIWKVRRSSATA